MGRAVQETDPALTVRVAGEMAREGRLKGLRRVWASLVRSRMGLIGLIVVSTMVVVAVFAPVISPHDPYAVSLANRLRPGFWDPKGALEFPLGTDQVGRDLLTRLLYGARVSLFVAASAVLITSAIGIALGLVSAYQGGRVDYMLVAAANTFQSIPFIVLALAVITIVGPSLANIVWTLGVTGWPIYYRIVRGQTLVVREEVFVEAARAIGCPGWRIVLRHILPNVSNSIIVLFSLQVATMIIMESFISFVGLGIQPPTASWGSMLAQSRDYLLTHPWLATFPGLAILVTVLGINLLGDWLRDVLDPHLSNL